MVTLLPVLELRLTPVGSAPELIDQVYGDVPPDTVHVAE
jgi:hypothetical protein